MNGIITKSTFDSMGQDAKFGVLYDLHMANQEFLKKTLTEHGERIEKLCNEIQNVKAGWRGIRIPALFGILGGAMAMGGKWLVSLL